MKRTLTISLVDNNYQIKSDNNKEIVVNGEDLILNGKDLYDAFFCDVKIGEQLELNVEINDSVVGGREKHISEDIKKIIENIVKKINENVTELQATDNQQ